MKMIPIVLLLALLFLVTDKSLSQSSIVFETGTTIEVTSPADICADVITIQGSYSGNGTQCTTAPLPVELISFTAVILEGKVILKWQTATEVNNYGFEIERKPIPNPSQREGNNNIWQKIGFVQGHGNSNSPKNYFFIDEQAQSGKSFYRLKQIDFDGQYEYSDEVEVYLNAPADYVLKQNFPNPFNPATTITYSLPKAVFVTLKIFDGLGREVTTLVSENKLPGKYEVKFDGTKLSSGIYFYKLTAGNFIDTKKFVLMK